MRIAARVLAAAAIVWMAVVVLAPMALASSHPLLASAAAAVYAAGGYICHQRPERSFHLEGTQLPVCARCTGLYAAAALGAPLALFGTGFGPRSARWIAGFCALPTAVTWGAEWFGLAHPTNIERAIAALPLGFAAAWLVVGVVQSARPNR